MAKQKMNYTQSGAPVEIGRTTLGSTAATITLSSLPLYKYLKFVVRGTATGGTFAAALRFNNDSGGNYNYNVIYNNAGPATYAAQGPQTQIQASTSFVSGGNFILEGTISNIATLNKVVTHTAAGEITNLANGYAPAIEVYTAKWVNTTDQISRIDVIKNAGTGSMAAGSEIIVWGYN